MLLPDVLMAAVRERRRGLRVTPEARGPGGKRRGEEGGEDRGTGRVKRPEDVGTVKCGAEKCKVRREAVDPRKGAR